MAQFVIHKPLPEMEVLWLHLSREEASQLLRVTLNLVGSLPESFKVMESIRETLEEGEIEPATLTHASWPYVRKEKR